MNQNFYNSNSSGFDQFQPPQYSDVFQPPEEISIDELKIIMQSYCEIMSQRCEQEAQKEQELQEQELAIEEKQEFTPSTTYTIHLTKSATIITNPFEPTIQQILEKTSFDAITPEFSITDSLRIRDEHLSTIPEMESDEVIKSSVKNLVPILSESEVTTDNESGCDVPVNDESSPIFTTFSNPLFDCNDDFTSSNDKSSLVNSLIAIQFYRIKEADFDLEKEIRLVVNFSYDNSSPRPLKEFNAKIADMILESLSPSPIPVEDSDSLMEEINLFLATNDLMPSGIENDDYDSEGDIHFLKEFLSNDPLNLPKNESSNFYHHDDRSFPRLPPEPQDVEVFFDFEPDTGVLTTKVVKGIFEHYVLMPNILPTLPTLDPDLDFTPSYDILDLIDLTFYLLA
nr:hypothetical protein [Tanacetum cinerariifolium]